ncbi:MAG: hypothetical protein WBX38_06450 [Candidatus Sulfotelmatobacter sp.]
MSGKNWRLLAVASWMFLSPALLLHGQNGGEDRVPNVDSGLFLSRSPATNDVTTVPRASLSSFAHANSFETLLFRQVTRSAGLIFSGQVVSIEQVKSTAGINSGSTAVTFHVEHAIRGTSAGKNLTIREWAGLSDRGERYRVGERVFLFLYPPSKLGLTSPVAGGAGRFAVNSRDEIAMSPRHLQILTADSPWGRRAIVPYPEFSSALFRFIEEK